MVTKQPLFWYGGKSRMVKFLLPLIPECERYIEVFGGGASLYFSIPEEKRAPYEVLNDIHEDLVNFYRVLRDKEKHKELLRLLEYTLYSRAEFIEAKKKYKNRDFADSVERAYIFFLVTRMTVNGLGRTFSICKKCYTKDGYCGCNSKFFNSVKGFPNFHNRLKKTIIECLDWKDLLDKYLLDGGYKNTFVYLDPPYVCSTRKSKRTYEYEFSNEQHKDLVEYLLNNSDKAKFMLSGYKNTLYEKLENNGWNRLDFSTKISASVTTIEKNKIDKERIESVWINY